MKIFKYFCSLVAFLLTIVFMLPIMALADDYFSTTGTVTPEKDIYYVGDTVQITDIFRNKDAGDATNVSVEYYYRIDGGSSVYSGTPIIMGTIAGGASESHSYQYTFKETDIGEYRIGSKITFLISGMGPYQEYSSGHDFTVMAAPTPTPTPTESPTPTPEPTPTPTPEATFTPEPTQAPAEQTGETGETTAPNENSGGAKTVSILQDRGILMTIIIVVGAVLVILIVIIIIMVTKKN